MKILYAARNNSNARIQLARFLAAIKDLPWQIKIAAYQASSPPNINIDWTLNCLLNIYKPSLFTLESDNLEIYYQQIKSYAPDLIISDLEYFTSYVAEVLQLPIWQCSSSLINYSLTGQQKYNLGAFKKYAHLLHRDERLNQRVLNLLEHSDINLVYSHFGDAAIPPLLRDKFEWIRPYHQVGKLAIPCTHRAVAGLLAPEKNIIRMLATQPDSVVFLPFNGESYSNILVKDIANQEEYFCNLKNSSIFLCQGQTSFLADAFYNGKYTLVYPNFQEAEAVLNSHISQHLDLSRIIVPNDEIDQLPLKEIKPINNAVKYLHQQIMELT